MSGLWGWDMLNGCFGRCRVSDVDGFVHSDRFNRFLWLEGKRTGASVPRGQQIAFDDAAKTVSGCANCSCDGCLAGVGSITVIVFWGVPPAENGGQPLIERIAVWPGTPVPGDLNDLRRLASDWWNGKRRLVWPAEAA